MISENGTSTLVHELFHTGFGRAAGPRADWIVEGLAEYYSVELLHRSGTTSARRNAKTLASLARWAEQAPRLDTRSSSGAVTARAVGLLHRLSEEIASRTAGEHSLDDVVRLLASGTGRLDLDELRAAVVSVTGEASTVLAQPYDQPKTAGAGAGQARAGARD
jgi:predicted metalloprotease with PDZ domain